MGLQNKIAQYREYRNGVSHCTFNPEGPGVVRIHLIPPRFRLLRSSAYIVILNGYYLLPIGYSWALLLSSFMEEVNKFDGKPITEADESHIAEQTIRRVRRVYPTVSKDTIAEDLDLKLKSQRVREIVEERLEPREKEIIVLRYGLNGRKAVTQRETAELLGISRSYVSRIEKAALEKLSKHLN